MRLRTKQWLLDAAAIGVGTALVALGLAMFTIPNDIAPGGVSGLATALTHVTGGWMTVGVWSLLLNVPLAAFAWWKLGFRPLCKTLAATLLLSVFIDLLMLVVPPYTNNPLLAAGFGGAVMMMLVLPHFFAIPAASSIASAVCLGLNAVLLVKFRAHLDWHLWLLPTIPYLAVSTIVIHLVEQFDLRLLSAAFGGFLMLLSAYFLVFARHLSVTPSWKAAMLCGAAAGVTLGVTDRCRANTRK